MTEEKKAVRQSIEAFFRKTARDTLQKTEKINYETLLDISDKDKRILFTMPMSIGDVYLLSSLFRSCKEQYPDYNIYVATKPEYFSILKGNKYVHRVIPFIEEMNNLFWAEGIGNYNGLFSLAFLTHVPTQKIQMYQHNGLTKIAYPIYYENDVP